MNEKFYQLTPEIMLDALDKLGLETTGLILQLNSMENRVYEAEVYQNGSSQPSRVVAKFYRPGRWTKEQIQEEHQFLQDLYNEEIEVIPPLSFSGESVFELKEQDIFYCVFPKKGGRLISDPNEKMLKTIGMTLARLHIIGRKQKFQHRIDLNSKNYIDTAIANIEKSKLIPDYIFARIETYANEIKSYLDNYLASKESFRVHGDFHYGNVLWKDETPLIIDFDDCVSAPAEQDLWLCCPYATEQKDYWDALYDGYDKFSPLPDITPKIIEILRATRIIHYNGWIAKRYEDPTFSTTFPNYTHDSFWNSQFEELSRILEILSKVQNYY